MLMPMARADRGQPTTSARYARQAALAAPSTGGAVRRRMKPSGRWSNWFRAARG